MKTLYDLIEKMKADDISESVLLETWLKDLKKYNDNLYYGQISGFMWGLCATGYMNKDDRHNIMDWFINEYRR